MLAAMRCPGRGFAERFIQPFGVTWPASGRSRFGVSRTDPRAVAGPLSVSVRPCGFSQFAKQSGVARRCRTRGLVHRVFAERAV